MVPQVLENGTQFQKTQTNHSSSTKHIYMYFRGLRRIADNTVGKRLKSEAVKQNVAF